MPYNILGGQLFFFLGYWVQLVCLLCLCLVTSLLLHTTSEVATKLHNNYVVLI